MFPFLPWDTLCLAVGTIILPQLAYKWRASKFGVLKKCLNSDNVDCKMYLFRHFFRTSNFDSLLFLGQLRYGRVIYLKRKPHYPPFERRFETGRISVMGSSRLVLLKVVLFGRNGRIEGLGC